MIWLKRIFNDKNWKVGFILDKKEIEVNITELEKLADNEGFERGSFIHNVDFNVEDVTAINKHIDKILQLIVDLDENNQEVKTKEPSTVKRIVKVSYKNNFYSLEDKIKIKEAILSNPIKYPVADVDKLDPSFCIDLDKLYGFIDSCEIIDDDLYLEICFIPNRIPMSIPDFILNFNFYLVSLVDKDKEKGMQLVKFLGVNFLPKEVNDDQPKG